MKGTFTSRSLMIFFIVPLLAGCGLASDNSAAREVAGQFYDALKTGDIVTAASLCGTDDVMTTQAWQDLFTQNINTMGKVTDYKASKGFSVSKEGGKSTVKVAYAVTYEYGKSADSLTMISLGDKFKIYTYAPIITEAKFQDELNRAKAIATEYMNALQAGDHSKALSYVGYSGSSMHSADEWDSFYTSLESSVGRMTGIQLNNDACKAYLDYDHEEAGKGNVYSVVYFTDHNGTTLTHQIDFFQPTFGDDLKIIAHNVK